MKIHHRIQAQLHDQFKALETKEHQLTYLFLEISRKCNLDCLHCGSDCKNEVQTPELTTESWIKIIQYIKNTFGKSVTLILTGGEPLLHTGLEKIIQTIHKLGLRWGMVSNGLLLQSKLPQLIDAGIYSLTLSLDGLKEEHNYLRNNPVAFNRIIDAFTLLKGSSIQIKDVVTCVYPGNLNILKNIADLLLENGIISWRLFRINTAGRAKYNKELSLNFEQTNQLVHWIKTHKNTYKKKGLQINLSCEGWLPIDVDKKVRDFPFFCRSGINIASILCDGTITGCSNNHSSFHVGNILEKDFAYVWEHEFDEFRNKQWLQFTECKNCEHLKSCNGNSMHLWEKNKARPSFCYAKDILEFCKAPQEEIQPCIKQHQ